MLWKHPPDDLDLPPSDENNKMLSQEQYEYEEHALNTYHAMVCECLPNHNLILTHHTDWRMIEDEFLPKSWTTVASFKKDCQHIDFTDTLDGAVCNDCQTQLITQRELLFGVGEEE